MKYIFGFVLFVCVGSLFGQDEPARPDVPGEVMVDVGLNYWDKEPLFVDQKGWSSKSIGIYYSKRKGLAEKFSFYYGMGLGMEKVSLGDSLTLSSGVVFNGSNGDSLAAVALVGLDSRISYDKNRLAMTYLDIPLEMRFHPGGTQDGEGFFIGAGGVVGLRLNSHSKLKYDDAGETVIEKVKGGYNLSALRYGVQFRLGFKGVHLFYKKYFNDTFKDAFSNGVNPRMTSIGINVTGF